MSEGYKNSPLGMIPSIWEVNHLGQICDVRDGTHDSPKYHETGIPFVTSKNLTDTQLSFEDIKFISVEDHNNFSKRSHVENGDILFGMIGTVGKPIIVKEDFEFSIKNVALLKFGKSTELDNFYALNVLKSKIIDNQFKKMSNGGVLKFVSLGNIRNLIFPLPPLPEQQKIAEILSTVDAKIEVIDQQITETQALKKGLMQRLLTKGIGHTEFKDSSLGEIPKSWEVVKIGDVLKLGSGKDYKHLGVGTIPVYGTGGIMTYVDNYLFDGESVGIGRKGTIDKPVLLKNKFWTVDTLFYTHSFNNITPYFVYIVFQSIKWRGYSEATGVPSLSKNIIEPINIPLPTIDEQVKISNIFTSIDSKLEVLSEKKTHYQELKQGLMQQLLTGKIRVFLNEKTLS